MSLSKEPIADDTSLLINDSADGLNDSTLESVNATDQVPDHAWIVYKLDCLSPSDCTAAISDTGDLFTVSALNSAVDRDDPVPICRSARLEERAQRVDQLTPDTAGNTAPATTLTDLDHGLLKHRPCHCDSAPFVTSHQWADGRPARSISGIILLLVCHNYS